MSFEVVAVRWSCWACAATAITAPDRLPDGWFEWPAPPWRAHHEPRHACPDHAADALDLHRRQWAAQRGRTHAVSVEEYEAAKVALRHATFLLDRLKFSGG
ncbi:MAG TPA: hypothetical protein VFM94_03625, partial [Solirubrobacterales bacterium]|nr:hypothetical protein [Solirubrobacterales bacterium]